MGVTLPITGPYTAKDQYKATLANKFIGRGSINSSTHKYMLAYKDNANTGTYVPEDVVFISAEGARRGRKPIDVSEIRKAALAGAYLLTDTVEHRHRPYNVGEREVEALLISLGVPEVAPGEWCLDGQVWA